MGSNTFETVLAAGGGVPNGIPTGIDWPRADLSTEVGRREISEAVNGYFKDVREARLEADRKAVAEGRKITLPGAITLPHSVDLDANIYGVQDQTNILQIFRMIDRRGSRNPTHQIANVDGGAITFEQKREGEPAKLRKVNTASPVSITSVTYQGALGIEDEAKRFDEYMVFEESVQRVPSLWRDYQATRAAALLTALGAGVNESFDTSIAQTLNNAGAQIIEDVGDTYGLPDQPTFVVLYNHRDWRLVRQALASNYLVPNDTNSGIELQWNIVPIPTRKIPTTYLYMGLPGYDTVHITWDDLYSESGRSHLRGADELVWRARENLAIGNVSQWRRVLKS